MNELKLDPKTGQWIVETDEPTAQQNSVLRRSWSRSSTEDGQYDFKFPFEGATVFAKYIGDLPKYKALQEQLMDESLELQARSKAFQAVQTDPASSIPKERVKELQQELEEATKALNNKQVSMAREVVGASVIGWENGALPYSIEAREDLPNDILLEWVAPILNQSQLSEKEADFLPSSSPSSFAGEG